MDSGRKKISQPKRRVRLGELVVGGKKEGRREEEGNEELSSKDLGLGLGAKLDENE